MKKLLSLLLCFVMVISILAVAPVSAGASAETDRITNQIKETYTQAKSLSGKSNFSNDCTVYVKYQLIALGITSSSDSDIKGNGNQVYNNITTGATSTGYTKTKYSGNNCLYNIINSNSGNVYNIVVSWDHGFDSGTWGYGHVLFIHAIIDNTVYFSENYAYNYGSIPEGSPLIMSLSTFMSKWNGMYGNAIGAVHFTKSHTHSYDTYVYYWDAHPHYKCYKCSCGEVKENRNEPTYVSSCSECNHQHSYTTHSHYGSAHPHYKYNKCSCGATQATSTTSNVATCTQCPISNPWIKTSRNTALSNESIVFTFGADNATSYDITIKHHDTIVKTATNVKSGVSYSFTEEGGYTAYITAKNSKHSGNSSTVTFYVVDALDFGSYFVAKLNNPVSGYYVSAGALGSKDNYPNVYLASEDSNSNNEWIFIRQEDRSYKVVNKETGYCLDVSGGSHHNGTNIGCYPSNDTVSQRWYIRKNIGGYALVPKLILSSDLSIAGNNSIYGECIFDGANIALYGNDSVQSQRFVFEYTIEPIEEWLEIDKTYVTNEQEVTFNFGADYVQKYTIHIEHEFGDIIEQDIDSGDSLSFDETGLYTAYVICTLKDGTKIKTDSVSFYNMIVYDFGETFNTRIKNTASNFYVANDETYNVIIASELLCDNNLWNFDKQNDGSYKITNVGTGSVLELLDGKVNDKTNIVCSPDNDSDSQRWYITKNISGYALAPKKDFTKYLSVFEHDTIWWYGDHTDGANIVLYDLDNVESQRFDFEFVVNDWIQIDKNYLTSEEKITFDFGADNATKYTLNIIFEGKQLPTQDIKPGDSLSFEESGAYSAYVTCTIGENDFEVNTEQVHFYNMKIFDYGKSFTAKIRSTTTGFYVATDESKEYNVLIASEVLNQNNVWNFERQDDGSYEITNTETGYVLDLAEGKVEDRTNIICTPENDSDTQRWYITKNISGYALATKKDFTKYLSVFEHDTIWWYEEHEDGANIVLYDLDNVESQRFELVDIKQNMLLGDVDGDKKISIMDATEIQRHIAQLSIIFEDRLSCADTDKDGIISVMDATQIQRFIAQLIPEL